MKKVLSLVLALSVCAMPALAMDKGYSKGDKMAKKDQFFSEMDTNNDGVVNQSEHTAFSKKKFQEADTNNDRLVSREELWNHKRRYHEKEYGSFKDQERYGRQDRFDRMSPSAGERTPYRSEFNNRPTSGSKKDEIYGNAQDSVMYWDPSSDSRYPSDRYNENNQ